MKIKKKECKYKLTDKIVYNQGEVVLIGQIVLIDRNSPSCFDVPYLIKWEVVPPKLKEYISSGHVIGYEKLKEEWDDYDTGVPLPKYLDPLGVYSWQSDEDICDDPLTYTVIAIDNELSIHEN